MVPERGEILTTPERLEASRQSASRARYAERRPKEARRALQVGVGKHARPDERQNRQRTDVSGR
jgi:hypothetical protein